MVLSFTTRNISRYGYKDIVYDICIIVFLTAIKVYISTLDHTDKINFYTLIICMSLIKHPLPRLLLNYVTLCDRRAAA